MLQMCLRLLLRESAPDAHLVNLGSRCQSRGPKAGELGGFSGFRVSSLGFLPGGLEELRFRV